MKQQKTIKKTFLILWLLLLSLIIVIVTIFILETVKPGKIPSLIIPKGKLEQFPTIDDNTYSKEVDHQELPGLVDR